MMNYLPFLYYLPFFIFFFFFFFRKLILRYGNGLKKQEKKLKQIQRFHWMNYTMVFIVNLRRITKYEAVM